MDGRCHICRRYPLEQDPLYSIPTCRDCNADDMTQPYISLRQAVRSVLERLRCYVTR